ncbi:MAG: hypothetical protein CVU77_02145 [Elusimicrobia bacterium HGW-Elusimicrobia-1]|nr:MAG: hypothetical protein CVU77_02145 [Elusimicrobia bacterium HGW-Elusimicrobia-1]
MYHHFLNIQELNMTVIYLIIFLSVASAVYLGTHYFVYHSIISGYGIAKDSRAGRILRIVFLLLGLWFPAGEFLSRTPAAARLKTAITAGGIWIGLLTMTFFILIIRSALTAFLRSPRFKYYSLTAALALSAGATVFAVINASGPPTVREITVTTDKFSSREKFTLVQITDLHLNYARSDEWVEALVSRINALEPDAVVITGDLIDARLCGFNNFCEILSGIRSKHGVFAITGNHEYYVGLEKFEILAEAAGIKILYNQNISPDGKRLTLIGINDDEGSRFAGGGPDFAAASKGADFSKYAVLLYHRPAGFDGYADAGIDLQLSGHTHWGQIPPVDIMVRLLFKYPAGLYRRGTSLIYTSPGTGTWGPPMRFFSKSEITAFQIKGAAENIPPFRKEIFFK